MSRKFDPERFASLCKALAHPARVRILAHLLAEDRCFCGEIVKILPLAQSTVSQHLKALKDAGLIGGEIEGLCTCYCADKKVLAEFAEAAAILEKGKINEGY